ncbi:MAG: hypothetical protein JWO02_2741 [Solirubrobacterales bacterium]|nr:hypothetical protein [Solirubrobacterales bacterium]
MRPRLSPLGRVLLSGAVLALASGTAVLTLTAGTTGTAIGQTLLGIAGVGVVSLMFLLVGESEDRERDRERERARRRGRR